MTSSQSMSLDDVRERVTQGFSRRFRGEPTLTIAAPGRVNLIGEHTDYNDGFVFPAAINRHVVMAVRPRVDRRVCIQALDLDDEAVFDLDDVQPSSDHGWNNYQRGVAWALQDAGYTLKGFDAVMSSDVPVGAGLSSSAAVEIACAYVFQTIGPFELDGVKRALLCQKAENEFVGMRCGIMDQYIISLGKRDHALLIDCRSLDYSLAAIPSGYHLLICNTNKHRGLVDSEYNTRRQECETGASTLGVKALRDVTPAQLEAAKDELSEVVYRRCRHIVTENERVMQAVEALGTCDIALFGALMNQSHVSLRDDYEVSCAELDAMVDVLWEQPGVVGARMTGAGFGGCAVALVEAEQSEATATRVAPAYQQASGLEATIYVCAAEDGVRTLA